MSHGVKSFADMYKLFGAKEPSDMGYIRKTTPEKLDKMIQFIHHYQSLHDGQSPSQVAIANEVGQPIGGISWFINQLINDNRLEKISSRPYRVRILEHPKNRAAIRRLEKALEAARAATGELKPAVVDPVLQPTTEPKYVEPSPPTSDAAQIEPVAVAEISPPVAAGVAIAAEAVERFAPQITAGKGMSFAQASAIIRQHGGDLELIARTYIMNTAKPGDLLEQLLERGYTVAKTNPKWR